MIVLKTAPRDHLVPAVTHVQHSNPTIDLLICTIIHDQVKALLIQ